MREITQYSDDEGGRGWVSYPLQKSYLGVWLKFVRIQSVPVSVITVSMGYATVSETILTLSILPLVGVTMLGHLGFYAMNDYFDYPEDALYKEDDKPLVAGDISMLQAHWGVWILTLLSISFAFIFFSITTFGVFIVGCLFAYIYNKRSKRDWFSGLYLSGWGIAVVLTGSLYAGGFNEFTAFVCVMIAIHMLIMTIQGDVKDLNAGEPSIPRELGCKTSGNHMFTTVQMSLVMLLLDIASGLMLIGIVTKYNIAYAIPVLILWMFYAPINQFIINQDKFKPDKLKKVIALYTIIAVIATLFASISFMGLESMIFMTICSVGWGLFWQKVQFGSALYFP